MFFCNTITLMKVKVKPWRLIWRFLVLLLVIFFIVIFFTYYFFITIDFEKGTLTFVQWDYRQPLILSIMLLLGIGAFIPSLTSYYYVIEDKYFIMKKYWKEYEFNYSNIEFIDIEESKRKDMVIFYSPKSKMKYLLGDRDGKLLETIIKKCPKNMSVAEFRRKHPEERY